MTLHPFERIYRRKKTYIQLGKIASNIKNKYYLTIEILTFCFKYV